VDNVKERALLCPQDISLVGHNDIPLIDVVSPSLTTIRIEHREMGRIAANMLTEKIKSGSIEIRHVVLRPKLVVRGSTALTAIDEGA
jgi:LacI family transcriptional regulator